MPAATVECLDTSKRDKAAQRAAEVLRRGGLVVFPTETVYGVAASLTSERGIARLGELKEQNPSHSFTVHIPDPAWVERYVDLDEVPILRRLVRKTMPGPITYLVQVSEETVERKMKQLKLPPAVQSLIYDDGWIALRCPDHSVASAMLEAVTEPVVAVSASPDGGEPHTPEAARDLVGDKVDLILDGGATRYSKPSTIVRVNGDEAEVIREGVFDQRYLDKISRTMLLFVCSGNTCRSPMAEAIARDELAKRGETRVQVVSAGAMALPGSPITYEAEQALGQLGVSANRHVSRPLTPALAEAADVIFCMTRTHLMALQEIAPAAARKATLLDPAGVEVPDPIGAPLDVYVQCVQRLREMIRRRLDELGLVGRT